MMPRILSVLFIVAVVLLLPGCNDVPHIETGRDFNQSKFRVMDTLSDFHLNDNFLAQIYNPGPFGFDSIDMRVYSGTVPDKNALVVSKRLPLDPKAEYFVIKGRKSDPITARQFFKSDQPGDFLLEFRRDSVVVASKQLHMHNSQGQ